MSQSVTNAIYAISGDTPPQTWMSSLTYTGTGNVPSVAQPPPGYVIVDEDTYRDALRAQNASADRAAANAEYQRRLDLSTQRQQLIDTGMTTLQARILIPDPMGDYSIDTWV